MAMMYTSVLLLSLLGMASSTDDACVGADGRSASCESVLSWAMSADDEDMEQGLEMLQIKRAAVETTKCPVPDIDRFVEKGKGCAEGEAPPGEDDVCLNGGKGFMYLEEAWKQCGNIDECSFVMQAPDGQFFLRREFDPDTKAVGAKLYTYNCGAHMQEQTEPKADSKQKQKEHSTGAQKAELAEEPHESEEQAVVLDDSEKLIETLHPSEDADDDHAKAIDMKAHSAKKGSEHKAEAEETETEDVEEEESEESEEDSEESGEDSSEADLVEGEEESEESEESEEEEEEDSDAEEHSEEDGEAKHDDGKKSKEIEKVDEDAEEE